MTRIFRPLAALVALACALLSPVAQASDAHPPLWRVEDEDTIVYMFGTVHALPDDVAWYRGLVAVALESSLELVTEIGDVDPVAMQSAVLKQGVLPRGTTLRSLLNAEERTRYEAALRKLGMQPEALDPLKPWFGAVTVAMTQLATHGITGRQGVEPYIMERSAKLGQKETALETVDYQFGVFDSLPSDVQVRYLMQVVDNLDGLDEELGKIIAAWQQGKAEELAKLVNEDESDPELANALLYPRNKAWADWIAQRMEQPGIVFMAVGAGHLAGKGSVQEELAARGIVSQRIQ